MPAARQAPAPAAEEDFGDIDVEAPAGDAPQPAAGGPAAAPSVSIELPDAPAQEPELAPVHAFVPAPERTGHQPVAAAADGGEAALREALSKASLEVIERVVWEVVPELAETIIRENLDRLVKQREG